MVLTYFKQALRVIGQNKLFSSIYIAGTALAIASTTVFAIVYYIKYAPVYPEYNRPRTATLEYISYNSEHTQSSGIPYDIAIDYLTDVKNADAVAMSFDGNGVPKRVIYNDNKSTLSVNVKPVNTAFFTVFPFEFIDGRAFNQTEFDSQARVAAISDAVARKVFGTTEGLVGKTISLNYNDYTISGVFRESSRLCDNSFGEIFIPYTVIPNYTERTDFRKLFVTGSYVLNYLTDDFDKLQDELNEIARRKNSELKDDDAEDKDSQEYYFDRLQDNFSRAFNHDTIFNNADSSDFDIIKRSLFILLVLLIVPALNLSGIIAGYMDDRNSEIGVRKSFGATNAKLLSQILWENLILTIIGGIAGLVAAWLIIYYGSNWIFVSIGDFIISDTSEIRINPDMLFAPAVFIFSFIICLIINIISAIIPAKLAVSKPIVKTINSK